MIPNKTIFKFSILYSMIWGGKDVFLPNQIAKFMVGKLKIRGGKFQKIQRIYAPVFLLSF